MPPPNPLGVDDLERLNQAAQLVAWAQDLIRRLHACGADCQGHADTASYLEKRIVAYKQEFGGSPK